MTELVVARYDEPMGWLEKYGKCISIADGIVRLTGDIGFVMIYRKCDDKKSVIGKPIPNVGREAHTYLHHIVTRWDRLADWTIFCQADPTPHLGGATIQQLLDAHESTVAVVPHLVRVREWDYEGRLRWTGPWYARYESGEIQPAKLTLAEWFGERLGVDLMTRKHLCYHPGAIMGVPVARIKARPRAFYERLLEDVSDHQHPEESHYLERSWLMIFDKESCR